MGLYNRQYNVISRNSELWNLKLELLWRAEHLLQKLLNLVDVSLDLPVEGHERRVRPWSEILQVGWFSEEQVHREIRGSTSVCFFGGAGFRSANLFRSTVVTLNTTPLSQRIMKRRWENGQLPMLSPSLPACGGERKLIKNTSTKHKNGPTRPKKRFASYLDSMFSKLKLCFSFLDLKWYKASGKITIKSAQTSGI